MEEKEFNILNNIISAKKLTDDLLEEQILENEESFEYINTKGNKDDNEKNKNGIDIKIKSNSNDKNNNNEKSKNEEKYQQKETKTNVFKGNSIIHLNEEDEDMNLDIKIIEVNKNNKNNGKQCQKINKQIKNDDNLIENKRADNKKKNNKRAIRANSIDKMNININMSLDKNKNNHIYRSIDHKTKKDTFDNSIFSVNNKVNIYQGLFDNKMKKYEILKLNKKKQKIRFDSNDNLQKSKKREINSPSIKEIFSDDEIIQNHKNGNRYYKKVNSSKIINKNKNKNKGNYRNMKFNSNDNLCNNKTQFAKDYLEDDILSFKSKKIKVNRQCSLNSSMSNNSSEKFFQTYERFKESQKKHKKKIEYMKKALEDKEKKICVFKPKINKNSELIDDEIYMKQQKKLEKLKKKNQELKLKLKKEEQRELYINGLSKKSKNEEIACNRIYRLYEWEKNRKMKIQQKQINSKKLVQKEVLKKPIIDKNSRKIVMINYHRYINKPATDNQKNLKNKDKDKFFERLYIDDIKKRKERMRILSQIYSPTFTPKICRRQKHNQSDDDIFSHYKREKELTHGNEENGDIYKNNSLNITFADKIRDRLFKHKSPFKNNSDIQLVKINENKNEEKSGDDNDYINDNYDNDNQVNTETLYQKYKNFDINVRLESKKKSNNSEKNSTKNTFLNSKKQKRNINKNKSTYY